MLDLHIELQTTILLLERIAIALERLAGPAIVPRTTVQSTLADLSVIDPGELSRAREEADQFAVSNQLVPGSPAYLQEVAAFEQAVRETMGEDAVANLPWKVRR